MLFTLSKIWKIRRREEEDWIFNTQTLADQKSNRQSLSLDQHLCFLLSCFHKQTSAFMSIPPPLSAGDFSFRLQVIKYCLIQFSKTFRKRDKRDKRDNWLDNEGGGENAFFGRKFFFHSRSDFAKSRSTIVQSLPKPSWLSSNAITTKNEFSLYRKSRENKDEKKGSEKLLKSPKNRLAGALSNKPLVRVYLT